MENSDGLQIGVIVNDVASVNIDAKLVSAASLSQSGVVELQNGCACCSLADELLTSVEGLLESRNQRVRAAGAGKGGMDGASVSENAIRPFDAVVVELSGVADPMSVKQNWNFAKMQGHPVTEAADISHVVTLVDASTFGTDWMTWDTTGQRDGWVDPLDECAGNRKVPELLAEQIEAADVILINKVDLAGPEQVKIATALARSINEKATIAEVQHGRVALKDVLRLQHPIQIEETKGANDSHSHDGDDCNEPGCTEHHSHAHHSHGHATDGTASGASSCSDPDCTDQTHSHEHTHSSSRATSTDSLGIVNFVYRRDRPFNPKKLMQLLHAWPVPIKDELNLETIREAQGIRYEADEVPQGPQSNPFFGVLRSKGFCWMAPSRWSGASADPWRHDTVMYWSHAGKHFGISAAGKWWGTLTKQQLKEYFAADPKECERILSEDYVSEEFGDRRQEIVFIGVGIDEKVITKALDDCLLKEKGMERYRQELNNYMDTIRTTPVSSGLFDVGGVDHLDM
jgi:G3E family GTPase